jgi:hypothetical protein
MAAWRFAAVTAFRLAGRTRLSCGAGRGGEVCGGAVDDVAGEVGEPLVSVAGVSAQQCEGLVHVQAEALGDPAFGLLDDDLAVECGLELLGEGLGVAHVPFLQQADGGDVGQCLPDAQVGLAERGGAGAEQVERADDLVPQPHRQGIDGAETGAGRGGREPRPLLARPGQVSGGDRLPGAEAVQARSLVVLDLEQLDQPGFVAGGRGYP